MLAKLTSKNQITLPKAVVSEVEAAEYFEVAVENGRIVLTPCTCSVSSAHRPSATSCSRWASPTRMCRRRPPGRANDACRPGHQRRAFGIAVHVRPSCVDTPGLAAPAVEAPGLQGNGQRIAACSPIRSSSCQRPSNRPCWRISCPGPMSSHCRSPGLHCRCAGRQGPGVPGAGACRPGPGAHHGDGDLLALRDEFPGLIVTPDEWAARQAL